MTKILVRAHFIAGGRSQTMKKLLTEYWQIFKYQFTVPWVYILVAVLFFVGTSSLFWKIFATIFIVLLFPAGALLRHRIDRRYKE